MRIFIPSREIERKIQMTMRDLYFTAEEYMAPTYRHHTQWNCLFSTENYLGVIRVKRAPGDHLLTFTPTDDEKTEFVNKHNELRKTVTPPASNMREISWDDELEQLATDYSE